MVDDKSNAERGIRYSCGAVEKSHLKEKFSPVLAGTSGKTHLGVAFSGA